MALYGYKPKQKKAIWFKPAKVKTMKNKPRSALQKRLELIEERARKKASRGHLRNKIVHDLRRERALQYRREVHAWKIGKVCAHCGAKSIDCHHSRGRLGALLVDQRFWIPLCLTCHDRVHANPNWARGVQVLVNNSYALPLLCAMGEWNKPA